MKLACYSLLLFGLMLCQACNKTDLSAQRIKTVDSLSGSLNVMVKTLEKVDTVLLLKSIARFNYYKLFIKENVKDTITKEQADNLKHFYHGGENLTVFASNRILIVARAMLLNSQMLKLSEDLKNNVDPVALSKFIMFEKMEIAKLTEIGFRQQKIFHTGLEEFKNALPGIEMLIKSRNKGELPTIVKDTIVL